MAIDKDTVRKVLANRDRRRGAIQAQLPAIKFGPHGRNIGPRLEEIEIERTAKAAQVSEHC